MAKSKLTKMQKDKVRILKPIVDDWNRIHNGHWKVVPYISEQRDFNTVDIYEEPGSDYIHGILLTDIGGVCNAYGWTWAIYADPVKGVHFSI